LYACFYHQNKPDTLIRSLLDGIIPGSIEIDLFRLSGKDITDTDNLLYSLKLVKNGLTTTAMFGPDGTVLQPSEALYKKNILVTRGRFRPLTKVNLDMFEKSYQQFSIDKSVSGTPIVEIAELTLANLRSDNDEIDERDFLDRADILCEAGKNVLISNYQEYHRLVEHLSNCTKLKIGIVMGMPNLATIFNEEYYKHLKGGILESFAQLFSRNVKLYI
jgi:hypothetical protein